MIPLRHDPIGIPVTLVDLLHLHRILDLAVMSLALLIRFSILMRTSIADLIQAP